jgi:hypothetical protein
MLLVMGTDDVEQGIFLARRATTDDEFDPPVSIGADINRFRCAGLSLSADDRTLYFTSDRPGSVGAYDLWAISRVRKPIPRLSLTNGRQLQLVDVAPADSGVTIHDESWKLVRVIEEQASTSNQILVSAQVHPTDGRLYFAHTAVGLLRMPLNGTQLEIVSAKPGREFGLSADGRWAVQATDSAGGLSQIDLESGAITVHIELRPGIDDDPCALRFPKSWYDGKLVSADTCLIPDNGYKGEASIWKWPPGDSQPQRLLTETPESGKFTGLAFGREQIYVGRKLPPEQGAIGVFTGEDVAPLEVDRPLVEPNALAFDPVTGDLLISQMPPENTVLRLWVSSGQAPIPVEELASGFQYLYLDCVHMSHDGRHLTITDRNAARIYILQRSE